MPLGDNATEEGRQMNRRTELKVINDNTTLASATAVPEVEEAD
jgi:hypothetical protein